MSGIDDSTRKRTIVRSASYTRVSMPYPRNCSPFDLFSKLMSTILLPSTEKVAFLTDNSELPIPARVMGTYETILLSIFP